MEVFTLEEWENNFDALFKRVEEGETIGVVREDGKAAVFMPAEADFLRIHTTDRFMLEADFLRIHTTDNNDAD